MAFCAENNVGISYLSENGRFLARVSGAQQGNVLLRKAQYALSDNEPGSLATARPIIAAKVANYRNLLLRHRRNHPPTEDGAEVEDAALEGGLESSGAVESAAAAMGERLPDIQKAETLDELRGIEGECAAMYFGVLSALIKVKDFEFSGRSKSSSRSSERTSFLLVCDTGQRCSLSPGNHGA